MYGFPGAVGICLGQWAAGVCTHRLCHLHRKIPPSGYPQRLYQAEMAAAVADFLHTNLIAQYCHWQRPIQKQWIKMGWLKVLTHQTRPLGLEFWPGVYQLFYKKIHERLANMVGIPTLTFGAGIPPPWTHFFPAVAFWRCAQTKPKRRASVSKSVHHRPGWVDTSGNFTKLLEFYVF